MCLLHIYFYFNKTAHRPNDEQTKQWQPIKCYLYLLRIAVKNKIWLFNGYGLFHVAHFRNRWVSLSTFNAYIHRNIPCTFSLLQSSPHLTNHPLSPSKCLSCPCLSVAILHNGSPTTVLHRYNLWASPLNEKDPHTCCIFYYVEYFTCWHETRSADALREFFFSQAGKNRVKCPERQYLLKSLWQQGFI